MPSKNRIKSYAPDAYYHVYNRGVAKQLVFKDNQDYAVFLNIIKRHLSKDITTDSYGREYEKFNTEIQLLAYCLMPNHYHLFFYQNEDPRALEHFMRKIITAYGMYFNKKHKRVGPLFQDRYKAALIDTNEYLEHISRYIHLNPKDYRTYEWSSYGYYLGAKKADWLTVDVILSIFDDDTLQYKKFVEEYVPVKEDLAEIKRYLADL